MLLSDYTTIASASCVGIFMHLCIFMHGEWHIRAPVILLGHSFLVLAIVFYKIYFLEAHAWRQTILLIGGYFTSLLLSILTYRVFFHRLSKAGFPGPLWARFSKIPHLWHCRQSQNHLYLESLHRKYGDFVRTGPSELTVFHPSVFYALDGPKTDCVKPDWYDILHPRFSLVTTRLKSHHTARRRQWKKGFNNKVVTQYEKKFATYLDQLESVLKSNTDSCTTTDVRDLFSWFCFDWMGDFVFNDSFQMLERQEWHHIVSRLNRALSLLGILSPTPWLLHIAYALFPRFGIVKDWFGILAWSDAQMRKRLQEPEEKFAEPDFAHYLMEDVKSDPNNKTFWQWLSGDSLLAIVAGSHPLATSLIGIFFELSKSPEHIEKIYREVHDARVSVNDARALAKLPHLVACVNEGMRLHPSLLTGGLRKTSESGLTIANTFIPGGITVVPPRFIISRRDDCFVKGKEFIPERWTTKPEMVLNSDAFSPFGTGIHRCVGKDVGLDGLRMAVARIIQRYEFSLPPGVSGKHMERDLKDQFTAYPGKLELQFKWRLKEEGQNPAT